jgi:hypothetical protein
MQRMTRTKVALATTAIMGGGLGAMALLPGTAMAATPQAHQQGPTQSPPMTATAGSEYQYTFTASGDPSWSLAGAPAWLSINSATGTVSGVVPQGTTTFSYSVTVTNGSRSYTDGPYTVQVGHEHGYGNGYGQAANLSTSLSCPGLVRAGRTGSCTLTVTNSGSGTARDVTATIDLPSALQAENCGESADWRWGWNGSDCTISGNDATTQLSSIKAGQSRTVSVSFRATRGWSWSGNDRVEVTASAQSANGYGGGTPWGYNADAQSTAYVSVYGGQRY